MNGCRIEGDASVLTSSVGVHVSLERLLRLNDQWPPISPCSFQRRWDGSGPKVTIVVAWLGPLSQCGSSLSVPVRTPRRAPPSTPVYLVVMRSQFVFLHHLLRNLIDHVVCILMRLGKPNFLVNDALLALAAGKVYYSVVQFQS